MLEDSDLAYTFSVTVDGAAATSGVTITDPLPAGTSYVGCSGAPCHVNAGDATVTWDLGPTDPQVVTSVRLTVHAALLDRVDGQPQPRTLHNVGSAGFGGTTAAVSNAVDTDVTPRTGANAGKASYPVVVDITKPAREAPVEVLGIKTVRARTTAAAPAATAEVLPFTGSHTTEEAGLGGLLLVLGSGLVFAGRSRRSDGLHRA